MRISTKQKIINAAITTLAKDSTASLEEIAEVAGVGRATIYRHFESRSHLIREMLLQAGTKMSSSVEPIIQGKASARDKLRQMVTILIPLGAGLHFVVYEPLQPKDQDLERGHQEFSDQIMELCKALKAEGGVTLDIPDVWVVTCLERLIFLAWENIQRGDIAPNQAAELVIRTFFSGLGNGP